MANVTFDLWLSGRRADAWILYIRFLTPVILQAMILIVIFLRPFLMELVCWHVICNTCDYLIFATATTVFYDSSACTPSSPEQSSDDKWMWLGIILGVVAIGECSCFAAVRIMVDPCVCSAGACRCVCCSWSIFHPTRTRQETAACKESPTFVWCITTSIDPGDRIRKLL